ncbi:MAG TPA: curli assembly protein CsgF [bacterium]|nr:curli assembly protein CsgF [bacterium]HPN45152.1 curli assembly protein CsgF [bacterium]
MNKSCFGVFCVLGLILFSVLPGYTTELVHTFVNPNFGGNPYNASWLLSSAQLQDKTGDKASSYSYQASDPLEDFTDSINRQILSRLSSKLVTQIFGESELEEGHYEIGDYTIDVIPAEQGLRIEISDPSTGGTTTIELPYYNGEGL